MFQDYVILFVGAPTIATKEENKLAPRPYDDSSSDSSSLSSEEDDTRERVGLDFS